MSADATSMSRTARWKAAHGNHELESDTVRGHRLTLCRTCDDLHCEDCFSGSLEGATP